MGQDYGRQVPLGGWSRFVGVVEVGVEFDGWILREFLVCEGCKMGMRRRWGQLWRGREGRRHTKGGGLGPHLSLGGDI